VAVNERPPRKPAPDAPQEKLARDLTQVAEKAANLESLLDRLFSGNQPPNVQFPGDFPTDRLIELARALRRLFDGSADGALHGLTEAQDVLADTLHRHFDVSTDPERNSGVDRDGALPRALGDLFVEVGTARAWYTDSARQAVEESEFPDTAVLHSDPSTRATVRSDAQAVSTGAEGAVRTLRELTLQGSVRADNAERRIVDTGIAGALTASAIAGTPRKSRIERLYRYLDGSRQAAILVLSSIQRGADVANRLYDAFGEFQDTQFKALTALIARVAGVLLSELRRSEGGKRNLPPPLTHFRDGLRDGGNGPWMIVLAADSFQMGSPPSDKDAADDEKPQHKVTCPRPFAVARDPVTRDEYDAFCRATNRVPPEDQWGRGQMPVVRVSWDDATAYCDWLTKQTDHRYRLPSEAEWEYACRAGTTTRYWWGDTFDASKASNGRQPTVVGQFPANPWGLRDVHGNVSEWCMDTWHDNYDGAPEDGSAWIAGGFNTRVVRGGSWVDVPRVPPRGPPPRGLPRLPLQRRRFPAHQDALVPCVFASLLPSSGGLGA